MRNVQTVMKPVKPSDLVKAGGLWNSCGTVVERLWNGFGMVVENKHFTDVVSPHPSLAAARLCEHLP